MEFSIGAMKAEAMRKAFGIDIEKGRTGVYEDNAENRRLNRVGQPYGHKKQEEEPKGRQAAKQEEPTGGKGGAAGATPIAKHAEGASDEALKRAAADPKAAPEVKAAAEAEMKKRGSGEEKKGNAPTSDGAEKKGGKKFTLKDYSEDEIEEMSSEEFYKTFSKEANDFLKNLSDREIAKIGYGRKSDGSTTDYVVNHMDVQGSDENMEFELTRENGKYGWALLVARGATEETDEDGYSYWSGDGGKKIFIESDTEYATAKEAVADLQKKIKKMADGGEELKWENW